jgi:hypothetical protein
MMRAMKSSKTALATRRAWEPPMVKKLAIGTETKSAREKGRNAGSDPQPPAAPSTKLGFSFEMSLPLSARTNG